LYVDDVILFCKGTASNILAGSISHSRLSHITNSLGFKIGVLPFIYLGVPIFKGKPKSFYFQPVVDKIKVKLASWKASMLSFAGRFQLLKSVVQIMIIYSISTYARPINLIKELERYMRNFLWSGDLNNER